MKIVFFETNLKEDVKNKKEIQKKNVQHKQKGKEKHELKKTYFNIFLKFFYKQKLN